MCRRCLLWVGLIIALLHGLTARSAQYAYRITFTDKTNTPYSLSSPSAYLSSRALSRRTLQGITIDSADLPVDPAYINDVLTLTGGKFHSASRWLNNCVILVADTLQILPLAGKPYISGIKRVGTYSIALHKTGVNPGTEAPYAARKTTAFDAAYYNKTWDQTVLVHGNFLHSNGNTGKGKLIAVLDAGFIGTNTVAGFDSLRSSGRIMDTWNFTYANGNVYGYDGHGTEVLSNMAGYIPGTYVGSAPLAMYALYVTEYSNGDQPLELDNLLAATERADSVGADIVSISLGYDLFDNPADGQNFSELDGKTTVGAKAANIATKKGMLFVATAGNDGSPPIPGWGTHILTPGDADSALTVGATYNTGAVAPRSGYGPNAAGHVKPDVCTMGEQAHIISSTGSYNTGNGTSFSTPQIAGWAACLWQANPSATPYQLRQAIIRCASSYSNPGVQLGYGVPNFECTQQILEVLTPHPPFTSSNWVIATPNPFTSELTLAVSPAADEDVHFVLTDMAGRTIATWSRSLHNGPNKPFSVSVPLMPAGVYVLKATTSTQQQIIKLQKN